MGCYVIAVGGTGNKILESMVYAAAADAFLNDNGQPAERLDLLSVDVDTACGNTTRAVRAAEYYETVRTCFESSPYRRPGFHTRVAAGRWSMNLNLRAGSVEQMSGGTGSDRLLAGTLFTQQEMELEYSEGFRGHPDLGVLFFSDMLAGLEIKRAQGQRDEMNLLIDRIQADLDAGQPARLLLCGSIFGGTGASGIPALSRYFRSRFRDHADNFIMGAVLMLPYYDVPAADADENREITVKSDEFLDKARTALQYYGMESMVRSGESDKNGTFDAVYMLGLPKDQFVCARNYSTGSQSQENEAHLLEWLASRCAARFFRTGFRGPDAGNMDCYYYQWHTPSLCWESFDEDAEGYRAGYGRLLKACALYLAECRPVFARLSRHFRLSDRRLNFIAPYFRRCGDPVHRARLGLLSEAFDSFARFYSEWMGQIIGTLPPVARCEGSAPEGLCPSELLNADVLDLLLQLIRVGDEPDRRSGRSAGAARRYWADALEEKLHLLVKSPIPDRRGSRYMMRALGGARCNPAGADEAFSAFLTVLFSCA